MSFTDIFANVALPIFIALFILFGLISKIDIFESFVTGAKGGAKLAFSVLPYVVAMIFAVDIFKASGGFDIISGALSGANLGIPPEVLPIALMRPFSGGASIGLLAGLFATSGADSYAGRVSSTFMGSSETLFYTISLYLGSVGITKTRYIIPVALATDVCGLVFSCFICSVLF